MPGVRKTHSGVGKGDFYISKLGRNIVDTPQRVGWVELPAIPPSDLFRQKMPRSKRCKLLVTKAQRHTGSPAAERQVLTV